MITDCPSCDRQFRISAWQLSAANGVVQCGFCGEQFNALERLHDRPLPKAVIREPESSVTEDEIDGEPQFEIPVNSSDTEHRNTTAYNFQDSNLEPDVEAVDNGFILEDIETGMDDEDLVIELLGQLEQRRSIWGTVLWTFGVFALILIIMSQLVWFNRDWILNEYPEFRPFARQLCENDRCVLTRERDLASIVLVNRDVRDHPRYSQTLLVNATIENQSDMPQPYPRIRLTLFDTEGKITGHRVFNPADYLEKTIDIIAGMPANVPVHLVLELTGDTDTAVSFEFHFI